MITGASVCRFRCGLLLTVLWSAVALAAPATVPPPPPEQGRVIDELGGILSHRDRAEAVNRMLRDRLDHLLPELMRETGIDMWLVINREYAEDPVYLTLVPQPVFSARRTTMLVFFDRGPEHGVERLTVSRYPIADLYEAVWEGGSLEEQWRQLAQVIGERKPARIGINTSADWPVGDGLTAGLRDLLMDALPKKLRERIVSAQDLSIRWLESRSALELEAYPHIVTARKPSTECCASDTIICSRSSCARRASTCGW